MTVRENLEFVLSYGGKNENTLSSGYISEILDLELLLESLPHEISGGEQRYVAIGPALLASPEQLLLDEPFNGIDPYMRNSLFSLIHLIAEELAKPVLVISHRWSDWKSLTGKVYLLEKGQSSGYGIMEV